VGNLNLDILRKYANIFGTGLLKETTPKIAQGFINQLFHQWHVDTDMVTQYVQSNQSLWDKMAPDTRNQLGVLAERVGDLDFITPELFITGIKKDFPGVASLFLNWPEAGEWLTMQIDELKAGVSETQ